MQSQNQSQNKYSVNGRFWEMKALTLNPVSEYSEDLKIRYSN